jgi:ATP-dependent Lhr-like helicase
MDDPLTMFVPPVGAWFRQALGPPTPVQSRGWPSIAAGQNTLLLAPTGSGKTLAAFLACLDHLWRQPELTPGVRVLYISPLKALNNDIYRNLQLPLQGVAEHAQAMGYPLPELTAAVRTGDTPQAERQRLVKRPPHILITTPESLHLLLTSKARAVLGNVTYCIVDEIHALCPNKRGAFLALLLERLEAINPHSFVRIGLSATQKPLEEVARFLGGLRRDADGSAAPRPVTIVDAGLRKAIDLQVVSPVEHFGPLVERSIWPSIYRLLAKEIDAHRSTIVFANNRRTVERVTAMLNEELAGSAAEAPQGHNTLIPEAPVAVRAHHGSVALEVRQQIEKSLKEGHLRAVVATASLELGIDMGAVDLVCQVESPGNVARGLQRVGRAGHLVGQSSKGRLIPKTLPDLVNQAVLAAEMLAGNVEPIRVPLNCLDVLAQQIIAMVAMEAWKVDDLFHVVRQAYPYRDLSPQAFDGVLEMISGRFRFNIPLEDDDDRPRTNPATQLSALQPRVSWDRVHQTLKALPGSQNLAVVSGGTIPDMGQYAVVTARGLRIGELDEEFVYERRVGDAFLLGTNSWRIDKIDIDRVVVVPAEGAPAMVPFWHGEQAGRSFDLGLAQGRFLRELTAKTDAPDCLAWLQNDFRLDAAAARNLREYIVRQRARAGAVPSDRLILIDASRDPLGDWQVMLLTPFGARFHLTLRLALENLLRRRLGYRPQAMHHDDGLFLRLTDSDEPLVDLFAGLTAETVRSLVLEELAESPLFALRFRHNAARALLMPRSGTGKRAPLWLQRLRGRDLLQVASRHPDFPIVAETVRECLHDHLDLDRVQDILAKVQSGDIEVRTCRLDAPSPFAANLLLAYQMAFMYVYDGAEANPTGTAAKLDQELLDQLLGHAGRPLTLDAAAILSIERRLRGVGMPPRMPQEMAEWLRRLGDLTNAELEGPMAGFLAQLAQEGQAVQIDLAGVSHPRRWILAEEADDYRLVFGGASPTPSSPGTPGGEGWGEGGQRPSQNLDNAANFDISAGSHPTPLPRSTGGEGRPAARQTTDADAKSVAASRILQRFLDTHALVGLDDILTRYPFEPAWAKRQIESWSRRGRLVTAPPREPDAPPQWSTPQNFQQLQRNTLALRRREVVSCPPATFADFVARWQHVHPGRQARGPEGVEEILMQFRGTALPIETWERAVLPARVPEWQARWLDDLVGEGGWVWAGRGERTGVEGVAFLPRDHLLEFTPPSLAEDAEAPPGLADVHQALEERGALFVADLAPRLDLPPSVVRTALWTLARRGLATNDRLAVVRRGEIVEPAERPATIGQRRSASRLMRPAATRPRVVSRPEGRWSLIPWSHPDAEAAAVAAARRLLDRYGIAARELALLDPALPPWRILYEVLSRMELADEVRRGYFVEGLSGAQFALPDAARMLQDVAGPTSDGVVIFLNSLDPANLYASNGPFDPPLRETGRLFQRRAGNWVATQAGKPILLVEQQGQRLLSVPGAATEALARAVAALPKFLGARGDVRPRITVDEWDGRPVTSTDGKALLEAAGFVRDYQAMTWFAGW